MEIHGDNVLEILVNDSHLSSVHGHIANVVFVCEDEPRSLGSITPLARMTIGFLDVIIWVTLAAETSFGIDASLRTSAWNLCTLVYVGACLSVREQFVARAATAFKSGGLWGDKDSVKLVTKDPDF